MMMNKVQLKLKVHFMIQLMIELKQKSLEMILMGRMMNLGPYLKNNQRYTKANSLRL